MDNEKEKATRLITQAKNAAHNGELEKSIQLFKEAYKILPSEKLKKRIQKLEDFIANISSESEDGESDDMVDIGKKFFLHKSIAVNLYQYQKEGVLWFWNLFKKGEGGILGDDMGLGKTIQVIAFLAGMFDANLIRHVLIVAPLSILVNWEKEIEKWAGGIRIKPFHGNSKKKRLKNLYKIQEKDGILITTYGMVVSNTEVLCTDADGRSFCWDYIVLDEGHKIKNPTKTSKCVREIPSKFHYILTGTPIQNNLIEMWALFDFTQQGKLLGTRKTFDTEFQKPIVRAREKDASEYQQQVGNKIAESLRNMIAPFFLRRTKAEVFKKPQKKSSKDQTKNTDKDDHKVPELKTRKNDLIVWVYLSELQLKLYQGFVASERVKQCLMTTRSPLAELNLLKKISDHPRLQSTLSKLLSSTEEQETRIACGIEVDEENTSGETTDCTEEPIDAPPVEKLIEDSGKMIFLVQLMDNLKREKHRTIIFSQSRKMLDIIQKVLNSMHHKMLRIDGTINNPLDRDKIVELFQTDISYTAMLMTTQVGSVGLTLTGADRLVIFDPSWNPGTDAQAVDRVYRVGQTKNVVIYRLITCGSIEEKIYRKQIFKNAVMKQATGASNNPYRYFTNQELRELFVLDDPKESKTQMQLEEMHNHTDNSDEEFEKHLHFLKTTESIFGITHHDQLFSHEATNSPNMEFSELIEKQVFQAEQRVTEEFNNIDFSPSKKTKPIFESSRIVKPLDRKPPNKVTSPASLELSMATLNLEDRHNIEDEETLNEKESGGNKSSSHYVSAGDISNKSLHTADDGDESSERINEKETDQPKTDFNDGSRETIERDDSTKDNQYHTAASNQSVCSDSNNVISDSVNKSGDKEDSIALVNNSNDLSQVNQPYSTARDIDENNGHKNEIVQSFASMNNTSQSHSTSTVDNINHTQHNSDSQHESTYGSLYHTVAMESSNTEDAEKRNAHNQETASITNGASYGNNASFGISYEAVDVGCSPNVSKQHEYSLLDVVDMACSPCNTSCSYTEKISDGPQYHNNGSTSERLSHLDSTNLEGDEVTRESHRHNDTKISTHSNDHTETSINSNDHTDTSTNSNDHTDTSTNSNDHTEVSTHSNDSYQAIDAGCSPLRMSHDDKQNEQTTNIKDGNIQNNQQMSRTAHNNLEHHSCSKHLEPNVPHIVRDISATGDQIDTSDNRSNRTPRLVRDLGKSYRTPPVSPFVATDTNKKDSSQQKTSTPIVKKNPFFREMIREKSRLQEHSIADCAEYVDNNISMDNTEDSNVSSSAAVTMDDGSIDENEKITQNNSTVNNSTASDVVNSKIHETLYESAIKGSNSMEISLRASDDTNDSIYELKDIACSPIDDAFYEESPAKCDRSSSSNVDQNNDCDDHQSAEDFPQNVQNSSMHSPDNSQCNIRNSSNHVDVSVFCSESISSRMNHEYDGSSMKLTVGDSPTATTAPPSTNNRRRTTAQMFFNESLQSSTSKDSCFADTEPIDDARYPYSQSSYHSEDEVKLKEEPKEVSVNEDPLLIQAVTQDSTLNTSEESVFDLDRLKNVKKEEEKEEEGSLVIKESLLEEDEEKEKNLTTRSEDEKNSRIADSMDEGDERETHSFDEEVQIRKTQIEERRGLLLKLKELLLRNMGNKEIDERLFINIVDRIEKLKLDIL